MSNPNIKKTVNAIKPDSKPKRDPEIEKSPWLEDYLDCFTFKMKPVTQKFIERISAELIEWAEHSNEAVKLSQFFDAKRIPRDTWNNWVRYDTFKVAKQLALSILGNKREYAALIRKYEAGTVNFMMPNYDPDWKEMLQFRAKLKAESENNNQPLIITKTVYKTIPTEEQE